MRTDAHAPTNFDPADYRVIDYLDAKKPEYIPGLKIEIYNEIVALWRERIFRYFPDYRTGGTDHQSMHQCNHCGHPGIRWVAVVEHIPTGKFLAFGEICAERCELPGVDSFKVKFLKTAAQKEEARMQKEAAKQAWLDDNPLVATFLAEVAADEEAYRTWNEEHGGHRDPNAVGYDHHAGRNPHRGAHPFLADMIHTLNRYGSLTEKQTAAVAKFATRAAEFKKQDEERKAAEVTPETPLVEGRREIVGKIVYTKWQSSDYGESLKMLVVQDDGNKVWGTVPEALWSIAAKKGTTNDLKGLRISITAQVTRSDNDEHFGFYKRPTQPKILEEVTA